MTVRPRHLWALALLPALLAAAPFPARGPWCVTRHAGGVASVHHSRDGRLIASVGGDKFVRVRDALTGRELHAFPTCSGFACSVRISPDGRLVASAGYESGGPNPHPIHLADLTTGKELKPLAGHPSGTRRVVFTSDSQTLVSAGFDGKLRVWDVVTGKELRCLDAATGMVYSHAISADNRLVAACSGGNSRGVRLFDIDTGKETTRGDLGTLSATAVAFSPDGKLLACGGTTRVTLVELATGRAVRELPGYTGEVSFTLFSADGRILVTGSYDQKVRLWEVRTGRLVRELSGHTGWVWGVSLAPGEQTVASCSADQRVLVWDVAEQLRPGGTPRPLTAREAEEHCGWLASEDAGRAHAAIHALASDPATSLPYLRRTAAGLRPPPPPQAADVVRWIAELDADDFDTRERATASLEAVGEPAASALRKAAAAPTSLEARRRLHRLLTRLDPGRLSPQALTALRVVHALESMNTPASRALLQEFARTSPGTRLADEAADTLARLSRPRRLPSP